MVGLKSLDFYVVSKVISMDTLHDKIFRNGNVDELLVKWKRIENFTDELEMIKIFIKANKLNYIINKDNLSIMFYPSQWVN